MELAISKEPPGSNRGLWSSAAAAERSRSGQNGGIIVAEGVDTSSPTRRRHAWHLKITAKPKRQDGPIRGNAERRQAWQKVLTDCRGDREHANAVMMSRYPLPRRCDPFPIERGKDNAVRGARGAPAMIAWLRSSHMGWISSLTPEQLQRIVGTSSSRARDVGIRIEPLRLGPDNRRCKGDTLRPNARLRFGRAA